MIFQLNLRQYVRVFVFLVLSSGLAFAAGNPPDAPDNLRGSITGSQVTLTWDTPDDDDVVRGYNVYVNNQYTTTVENTSYTGPIAVDRLTSFHVVAFDTPPRRFSVASEQLVLPESLVSGNFSIPPSAPTNLTGSLSAGRVTLQWDASTDDEGVLGYNVFRDNRYIGTVSDTQYSGFNRNNESHTWYVVAFDLRQNFSAQSESIRLPDTGPVDTTLPPSIPTGLQGTITSGSDLDTVSLSWLPSSDDQAVAGYNIFVDGVYVATRFDTAYTGTVPKANSHAFQVGAFDFDQNFSLLSEVLTLPLGTTTANPGVPPSVPTGLASDVQSAAGVTTVRLSWSPSTGPALVRGYDVYRNNRYLNTVSTNSYTDTLRLGTAATYEVVAFDFYNNYSTRSEALSISGGINQAPFFARLDDQVIQAGMPWELVLAPVDVDGDAAGILVSDPPDGMRVVDNGDGTRSLIWQPLISDIGVYNVEVTAFDLNDTSLRSSQIIQISVVSGPIAATPPFSLQIANEAFNLIEGDTTGVRIPIRINRVGNFTRAITLDVTTETPADAKLLTTVLSDSSLSVGETTSTLSVRLGIDILPLLPEQRRLIITARAAGFTQRTSLNLAITPVPRDDVYLLIGQSNMVGLSETDAKRAGPGQADEPDPRIIQANVTANDRALISNTTLFLNPLSNFVTPRFTQAEDPLHTPLNPQAEAKSGDRIGMGLSFAKTALPHTTRNIILVPAAWSGSGFCNTSDPAAHWNAESTSNPALGNTLLFERALQRINQTLLETGGILRGILWHQGESDSNQSCAAFYQDNLITLVQALRTRIRTDARGSDARGASAAIPFVAGTMSRGRDARGDFSQFDASKRVVDTVHRTVGSLISFSAVTNNDDLVPDNGFPCGTSSCVHFGSAALREMGVRTYDSLLRAAANGR